MSTERKNTKQEFQRIIGTNTDLCCGGMEWKEIVAEVEYV